MSRLSRFVFSFISDDKPEFQPENNQHRRLKIHILVQILNPISLNPTQLLVPDWLFVTNLFFFLCVRLDARAVNCFKLRLSNF